MFATVKERVPSVNSQKNHVRTPKQLKSFVDRVSGIVDRVRHGEQELPVRVLRGHRRRRRGRRQRSRRRSAGSKVG